MAEYSNIAHHITVLSETEEHAACERVLLRAFNGQCPEPVFSNRPVWAKINLELFRSMFYVNIYERLCMLEPGKKHIIIADKPCAGLETMCLKAAQVLASGRHERTADFLRDLSIFRLYVPIQPIYVRAMSEWDDDERILNSRHTPIPSLIAYDFFEVMAAGIACEVKRKGRLMTTDAVAQSGTARKDWLLSTVRTMVSEKQAHWGVRPESNNYNGTDSRKADRFSIMMSRNQFFKGHTLCDLMDMDVHLGELDVESEKTVDRRLRTDLTFFRNAFGFCRKPNKTKPIWDVIDKFDSLCKPGPVRAAMRDEILRLRTETQAYKIAREAAQALLQLQSAS